MTAAVRHTVKPEAHKKALEEARDQGLAFTKGLLFFETTGAMGEGTQKWWKSVIEMEADQRIPKTPHSRQEHTWSANKFSSYWLQTLSMPHATCQDASIIHSSVDMDLLEGLRAKASVILPCAP